jgi:hypothetical protein
MRKGTCKYGVSINENKRIYTIWSGMMRRCYNKKAGKYYMYGERGISVCEEWHHYGNFYKWAISSGYSDDLSIDRFPNNNGNYEPSNCRWATIKQQARNTRTNRFIDYNGARRCLQEWVEFSGIKKGAIENRLKLGWSIESALTTPIRGSQKILYNGERYNLLELSEKTGIKYRTLLWRFKSGYTDNELVKPLRTKIERLLGQPRTQIPLYTQTIKK